MKRLFCIFLVLCLLFSLAACGEKSEKSDKLTVVTTIFPVYDWVRELTAGTEIEVVMLLDDGVDLHNYQPTAEDLLTIADCDAFVYVGGESDGWVADALQNASKDGRITLNLMELLGDRVKAEEEIEGMEHDHDHEEEDHDHEEDHAEDHAEEDHDHALENDEHIWLSLRNAEVLCQALAEQLRTLAPDAAAKLTQNETAYITALRDLDSRFADTVAAATQHTLIFADRFPFRYLADDYGLTCYAAFSGCSAETEASFETIVFLADRLRESGATCVLTIDGSKTRIADTVIETAEVSGIRVLSLNSMQATTAAEAQAGASYLTAMEENLTVLTTALQ